MTDKENIASLYELGFNSEFDNFKDQSGDWELARVTTERKERYTLKNEKQEYEAEIIGNLRYSAQGRIDFPAVGDWVAISTYDNNKALIHSISKRKNILKRQAIGRDGEEQIIATNIDCAFIVEAVNRDFSINRFQRYITICNEEEITPILVINKVDLLSDEELDIVINKIKDRLPDIQLVSTSCENHSGLNNLRELIIPQKTYCFLGSSGVGKSSLINWLVGDQTMKTDEISDISDRGKHTTTHRELIVLKQGGILIDNPGMREVGVTQVKSGLQNSFQQIADLSEKCRFNNCAHIHEKGCAVLKAVKKGILDADNYKNYLKLQREYEHYESSELERKQKGKSLSKMIKQVKIRKNKF